MNRLGCPWYVRELRLGDANGSLITMERSETDASAVDKSIPFDCRSRSHSRKIGISAAV